MVYNPEQSKDGRMAHEGGDPWMHDESRLHDQNGRKKERSPGVDLFDTGETNLDSMNRTDMDKIRSDLAARGLSAAEIDRWYGQL